MEDTCRWIDWHMSASGKRHTRIFILVSCMHNRSTPIDLDQLRMLSAGGWTVPTPTGDRTYASAQATLARAFDMCLHCVIFFRDYVWPESFILLDMCVGVGVRRECGLYGDRGGVGVGQ